MRLILCSVLIFVSLVNANILNDLSNEESDQGYGKPQRKVSAIVDSDIDSAPLTGKVAIVTGSTFGVGKSIVHLLSQLGALVVVIGKSANTVKRAAQEAQELSPQNLKPLQFVGDVTKTADINRLITQTINRFGKIDILVNNQGTFIQTKIGDANFMTAYDTTFNNNLRAVTELTHLAVPYLKHTDASIIQISSIAGIAPIQDVMQYSMAKAALDMFTKSLAVELGSFGIRVNTVSPGLDFTNINNNQVNQEQYVENIELITPLKLIGDVSDVAKGVAFLASPEAGFITGHSLVIDGGLVYNVGAINTMNIPFQYVYENEDDSDNDTI